MPKKEYDATDIQPVVGYGHDGSDPVRVKTDSDGNVYVLSLNELMPARFDEINLSYTGDDVTGVVYKLATVTVATLTLTYTAGKLTRVVRT